MSSAIVSLADVWKSYGATAGDSSAARSREPILEGLNLTIQRGEKVSLIGPSGSGKSTLLMLIAGLLRPDRGTVSIEGISMGDLDDRDRSLVRARRIGIALQADNLIPFLTAQENVALALSFGPESFGAESFGSDHGAGSANEWTMALLEQFGVAHRARHRPRHLSGGEAQRVALAVSVANDPDLLLADEVVAQLDASTASGVIDEVLGGDFAVLYVTHDVSIADHAEQRYALVDRRLVTR
jgi:putative ABC transport system ATP-binding protein